MSHWILTTGLRLVYLFNKSFQIRRAANWTVEGAYVSVGAGPSLRWYDRLRVAGYALFHRSSRVYRHIVFPRNPERVHCVILATPRPAGSVCAYLVWLITPDRADPFRPPLLLTDLFTSVVRYCSRINSLRRFRSPFPRHATPHPRRTTAPVPAARHWLFNNPKQQLHREGLAIRCFPSIFSCGVVCVRVARWGGLLAYAYDLVVCHPRRASGRLVSRCDPQQ